MAQSTTDVTKRSRCTCAHNLSGGIRGNNGAINGKIRSLARLDSSFVYVHDDDPPSTPTASPGRVSSKQLPPVARGLPLLPQHLLFSNVTNGMAVDGPLLNDTVELVTTLLHVANADIGEDELASASSSSSSPHYLCRNCVTRIANAIDDETSRLHGESQAYLDAIAARDDAERNIRKALTINAGLAVGDARVNDAAAPANPSSLEEKELVQSAIASFESEIAALEQACAERGEEINLMQQLLSEQHRRSEELTMLEDAVLDDVNALEIDAIAMENTNRRLVSHCVDAYQEIATLATKQLHPLLFRIDLADAVTSTTNDKPSFWGKQHYRRTSSAPSYAFINDLRLAHRPKNDGKCRLDWDEINAAWAQAAQLVMSVAGTLNFSSAIWRIVPMSTCAKIIQVREEVRDGKKIRRKVVHDLGWDSSAVKDKREPNNSSKSNTTLSKRSASDVPTTRRTMSSSILVFAALLSQLVAHAAKMKPVETTQPSSPPFPMTASSIGPHHNLKTLTDDDDETWNGIIICLAYNLKWLAHRAGQTASVHALSECRITS